MRAEIKDLITNTYNLNLPIPVVDNTELHISIQEGGTYYGEVKIVNKGEGEFRAYIESVKGIISISDRVIQGDNCSLLFRIDTTELLKNKQYKDRIIITYMGGEIIIPVDVIVVDKGIPLSVQKLMSHKKKINDIRVVLNKKSYNIEESGELLIYNYYDDYISVKLRDDKELIEFDENQVQILDDKKVCFSFKQKNRDKKNDSFNLRTSPINEIKLNLEITYNHKKTFKELIIPITTYKKVPATKGITSDKAYKKLIRDLQNKYIRIILFENTSGIYKTIKDELATLINYNLSDIDLKLFYGFISLLNKDKADTLFIIKQIDPYILYYDKMNDSVSQVLLCLVAMLKGEKGYDIVKNWEYHKQDSIIKLMIKQYITADRYKSYDSYKKLYNQGINNWILYALAAHCLMHNHYYPKEHDLFYKSVIKWAINKDLMNNKWAKKLEQGSINQINYYNIDSHIASNLYKKCPDKSFLKLLAKTYIHDEISNFSAYNVFFTCLKDKIYIKDLEYYYVKAAYDSNQFIDFNYINVLFKPEQYLDKIKNYFYINLIIEKDNQPLLYNYHREYIQGLRIEKLPFSHVPKPVGLKSKLCYFMLEKKLFHDVTRYYLLDELWDVSEELLIDLCLMVYKIDKVSGSYLLLDLLDREIYNEHLMNTVVEVYNGSLVQLLHFYSNKNSKELSNRKFLEKILYKGIMTRQYPNNIFEIYLDYLSKPYNIELVKQVNEYYAAQILIEDYVPNKQLVNIYEAYIEEEDNLSVEIALLKSYYLLNIKNAEIINRLIRVHLEKGIVFSWYFSLIDDIGLWNNERTMKYFEYYSKENTLVYLYYRNECDKIFKRVKMTHTTLGMFVYKMVVFYNDIIEYYIEELDEEGNSDILKSDIYICDEVIEQEDVENIYDLINTALMSEEVNDVNSYEQAIERCMVLQKLEEESMKIL